MNKWMQKQKELHFNALASIDYYLFSGSVHYFLTSHHFYSFVYHNHLVKLCFANYFVDVYGIGITAYLLFGL